METEPKQEAIELTDRLVEACQRYRQLTGRYLFIDIYPVDPHFGGTDEYTYELAETGFRSAEND